jgi:phage baseplate assembly protein W
VTAQVMKKTIFDTINKFEPRATVLEVVLREKADTNELVCDIIFRLNNSDRPITLTTLITRVR